LVRTFKRILVGASAWEIRRKAMEEGMMSLRQSGLAKIKAGMTTMDEVLRGGFNLIL
jgi:type IV pilus assembly protein PilB